MGFKKFINNSMERPIEWQLSGYIENLKRQIDECRMDSVNFYKNNDKETKIKECLELQMLQEKNRVARESDEAVLRAYCREGGIYDQLFHMIEFADDRMDEQTDINLICTAVYNSTLDMAAYQFKKLDLERQSLMNQDVKELGKEAFLRNIGWQDDIHGFMNLNTELSKIENRVRGKKADSKEVKKQLNELSTKIGDLKVVNASNLKRLDKARADLQTESKEYHENDELNSMLMEILSPENLDKICTVEGISPDEYKQTVHDFANEVWEKLLKKWPKP